MMEIADFAIIVSLTTMLTTASTYVLLSRMRNQLEKDICNKITSLLVRVGVLEAKHD